ncbi:hypothetical protein P7C73_g240, partial [Tremellales sp. Uapishka_1]
MHSTSLLLAVLPLLALTSSAKPHDRSHFKKQHQNLALKESRAAEESREVYERTVAQLSGNLAKRDPSKKRQVKRTCRARTTSSDSASATATDSASASTPSAWSSSAFADDAAVTSSTFAWSASTDDAVSVAAPSSSSSTEAYAAASQTYANDYSYATSSAAVSSAAAAPSSSSTAVASSTSSASSSSSSLTPNGIKAGLSAGDALDACGDHIGWWYDWSADPSGSSSALAIPMLWGDGSVDSTDASRLAAFKAITIAPKYIIGFEEPDCTTYGSSDIGVATAAALWDSVIAPWQSQGTLLLSPSMCHQKDETWLTPFKNAISTQWDITNLHINKNSMDGVNADLDYYWTTYGKPMWITEFACVDDSTGFTPCTDQSEINTFINDIVALFENDSRVYGYAYSNGEGLGDVWPMWSNGALTESGTTYLSAISAHH